MLNGEESIGCTMSVNFKSVDSTHGGNSTARECSIVMLCKGLAALVEVASITTRIGEAVISVGLGITSGRKRTGNRVIPSLGTAWRNIPFST